MPSTWPDGQTHALPDGQRVHLSAPVLVHRSKGYCWFPSVARLSSGDLMATINNYSDAAVAKPTAWLTFSRDGGLNWSPAEQHKYCENHVALANGDDLFLPYYMFPREGMGPGAMGSAYRLVKKGTQ